MLILKAPEGVALFAGLTVEIEIEIGYGLTLFSQPDR